MAAVACQHKRPVAVAHREISRSIKQAAVTQARPFYLPPAQRQGGMLAPLIPPLRQRVLLRRWRLLLLVAWMVGLNFACFCPSACLLAGWLVCAAPRCDNARSCGHELRPQHKAAAAVVAAANCNVKLQPTIRTGRRARSNCVAGGPQTGQQSWTRLMAA